MLYLRTQSYMYLNKLNKEPKSLDFRYYYPFLFLFTMRLGWPTLMRSLVRSTCRLN